MELAQLKYFVTIAETLSFTGAAELVHVSQPALSYQMKRLEEELGVKLFNRHGRSISLTPDGQVFLPMAQGVLSRANEAVRTVRDYSGVETGEVTMGVAPSVAAYLIPSLLASFHQVFPRVMVDLVEDGDQQLQHRVFTSAMDFAIVANPGSAQSLDVAPLGSEDLLAITPPTHHLSGNAVVDLAEFRNDDFVLPSAYYQLTTQIILACRRAGFEPAVAYHVASLETLKNLVRVGLGVSVLPSIALIGSGRENLAVLRIKKGLTRDLYLIRAKDRDITRAAQVLLTYVRTSVAKSMTYPPQIGHAPTAQSAAKTTALVTAAAAAPASASAAATPADAHEQQTRAS
jgi:DNA-binding transcriptional LysR family regulator